MDMEKAFDTVLCQRLVCVLLDHYGINSDMVETIGAYVHKHIGTSCGGHQAFHYYDERPPGMPYVLTFVRIVFRPCSTVHQGQHS